MHIFLVRHGDAVPSLDDSKRSLSEEGRQQIIQLAQKIQEYGVIPARIVHSGILRAEQTAQILAEILNIQQVEKIPGLKSSDAVETVLQEIPNWTQDTLLVSHLPYLAYLLGALVENSYHVQFDTGTAVCLENLNSVWQVQAVF